MTQPLSDFATYFRFFIGLFTLINPVGIIPVFISVAGYQPTVVHNKTNLTANLSVAIILLTSLFLGDGILQIFGISVDSFRIAGGTLAVTITMSMISGKLGEDKQNKQKKSETAVRESIGVIPLALPSMAGPGTINSAIVQGTRYHSWVHLIGSPLVIVIFALYCQGIFRMVPWLACLLGQTGINVTTRIVGLLLIALRIEFTITSIKTLFPELLSQWSTMQAQRLHFTLVQLLAKPVGQREIGC